MNNFESQQTICFGALITAPAAYRIPIFPILRERFGMRASLYYCREECSPGWLNLRHIHPYSVCSSIRTGRKVLPLPPLRLYWEVLLNKYACVVVSGWGHFFCLVLHGICYLRRVPVVVLSDTGWPNKRSGWKSVVRNYIVGWVAKHSRAAVVSGKLAAQYLAEAGLRGPIFIGHYSVDISVFYPTESRQKGECLELLFVGRIIERKGLIEVLKALDLVHSRNIHVRLTVAGDGPQFETVRQQINDLKLKDTVHLLGAVAHDDLPALMRQMDAMVVPSRREPWGVVVAEAAASGLALLCSDETGAAADLLNDGVNGYEFPTGDIYALSDVIEKLWNDKQKGRIGSMGAASRRVAENFSIVHCVEQYARAIDQAMSLQR